MHNLCVALFGPTGIGKTAVSLEIAKSFGEIISVDSRQVYKYLDIGTAKVTEEEKLKVKHHLIDIIYPDQQYSAGNFKRSAETIINNLILKEKIPFLVGGTGLYFKSLFDSFIDIQISAKTQEFSRAKWERIGQERAYKILKRIDPQYALKIHDNDKQRTIRALEVFLETKKKISFFHETEQNKNNLEFLKIGLVQNRDRLYTKINSRVDQMLNCGFIDEVKKIIGMGYAKNCWGLKTIGYKQIVNYLDNFYSLEDAISEIKKESRHYAKRQITWFKNIDTVNWIDNDDYSYKQIIQKIKDLIEKQLIKREYN
jgi:tRNA dimethylallyltransferase